MMANYNELIEQLSGEDIGEVFRNELLSKHCTWRIGGPADMLVQPHNVEQLSRLLRYVDDHRITLIVIGNGSNLLFDDAGFRGVVISISQAMSRFSINGVCVRADAGIAVPRLARLAGLAGLTGLEHTIGIPGTLGGLIAMNGGSLRRNIGDIVRVVEAMDRCGKIHSISRDECNFSYRHSVFQKLDYVIVRAELELEYGHPGAIRREMLEILRQRRRKFPRWLPNCGSVFASTVEMFNGVGPPGKLIEDAGLKGLRVGGAEVSRKHANFILNVDNAKAADVCELIRKVRKRVHDNTNFWMSCEVKYICCDGTVKPAHEVVEK